MSDKKKQPGIPSLLLAILLFAGHLGAQTPQFVSFSAADPVLTAYDSTLPAELKPNGQPTAAAWDKWIHSQDKEIRVRVEAGEENTLTNLLRLGVTYTSQPRIEYNDLAQFGHSKYVDDIANKRADDLVKALSAPHPSQGMLEMKALLEKKGYSLKTPAEQQKVKTYILSLLGRLRDDVEHDKQLAKVNRYQAFQDRGISTDSNLYPDYAIDLHLRHLMEQGLLKPGSVHRVGIVGPGLDFVNKKSGSDFYPPQTTQPFAVMDSLVRLGLADVNDLELYTFDISSRVNKHLERAQARSRGRQAGCLAAALDSVGRLEQRPIFPASSNIGRSWATRSARPPRPFPVPEGASDVWNRAVAVRPAVVKRITPVDMNIVFQTVPFPADKQFDLIIGTNIFVYYGGLEQSLARANLGTMIRPGGLLLSNEVLPNTAPSKLTDSLKTSIVISNSPQITDYMYTYARLK